jgi:flagellar biosynthesis/type III secretory pathway protein FliH
LPYCRYRDSDNIVARLNLPSMHYEPEERVDVYAAAVRGLSTLEPDPERQLKYADFIDIYSALDDNERQRYEREYPQETQTMTTYLQRVRQEGRHEGCQEGEQRGVQKGETRVLLRLLRLKFGEIPDDTRSRIEQADADTLLTWSERILNAERIDDIFR